MMEKRPDRQTDRQTDKPADKPERDPTRPQVRRDADKKPNPAGPQFEEGGQYPGVRRDPKEPRH
jgi:hypothetical protein